jgi:hypothetical protein
VNVDVDVGVMLPIVGVLVRMNSGGECFAQPPNPDGDEQDSHRPFAVGGDQVDRDDLTQEQRTQRDEPHSARVADGPLHSDSQGAPGLVYREWGQGGQMVRTGKDMAQPRNEARERNNHIPVAGSRFLTGLCAYGMAS